MTMPSAEPLPYAVLGGGAWGTALAETLAHAGNPVTIWDRDPLVVADINQHHRNRKRYPAAALHPTIAASTELAATVAAARAVLVALPSQVNPEFATRVAPHLTAAHGLVLAAKGFREEDGALLGRVWAEAAPATPLVVLTGPTFAAELMQRQLTACLVAGADAPWRAAVAESFHTPWFRVYEGGDIVGAQVGGALKNVLAIAAGLLDGLQLGHNARAALLTRGLAEMAKLARALGGQAQTLYGLAGMGDLLLTATSQLSRNYRLGQLLGKGTPLAEAKLQLGTVEGILAARIATVQAQSLGVEVAIIAAIDGVLHGDVAPLQALEYLMMRPREHEFSVA
ncbi:MAG: NAD(P)-dependent glycerol-3-phosphate dehydrogenase [Alphaproteobacteria bacterium]|jgi:glycerol-3-phosphate dehydrogenase (NAD(P)+)|nr:NAD(P)-dependent glycerol-3-phosphate dehydrogenase [Alphaproteobacteria bacterium]